MLSMEIGFRAMRCRRVSDWLIGQKDEYERHGNFPSASLAGIMVVFDAPGPVALIDGLPGADGKIPLRP